MKTFHTSGSADIDYDPQIVEFLYNHLINIEYIDQETFKIKFNSKIPKELLEKFNEIEGFVKLMDNEVIYKDIYNIENNDVTKVIHDVRALLALQIGKTTPITDLYHQLIKMILSVGDIYSSYIEIVLCNMYLTKKGEILRYALNRDVNEYQNIKTKLAVRTLHTAVSKLLGLLFEPNARSVSIFSDQSKKLRLSSDTIFEKLWAGEF